MIFSRKRGGPGRHARSGDAGPARDVSRRPSPDAGRPDEVIPEYGPYDVAVAPKDVQRLDLGSLQIPAIDGVEVRVQANPDGGVEQVVLVYGESALQLGVFAAPRSEGIWAEVRDEIHTSMAADGVDAQEIDGRYGVELIARVNTPQGPANVRFVGIDGPRWMVRALYQGLAAADPQQEGPLGECLSGLVVARDAEARPVREALPLRLPQEMAEQAHQHAHATAEDPTPPDAPAHEAPPSANGRRTAP